MRNRLPGIVLETLAADLACHVEDLFAHRTTVTRFQPLPGRRRFPITDTMLHAITIGAGTVICAGPRHESWVREVLQPMASRAIFSQDGCLAVLQRLASHGGELVCLSPDFLCTSASIRPVPCPPEFRLEMLEGDAIACLYRYPGLHMALSYYTQGDRPDTIAAVAWAGNELAGVAACSADNDEMWQVGIDVMPSFRMCGVAKWLVYEVTRTILERGKIPYYGCGLHNLASLRIACAVGYWPAWTSFAAR